MEVNKENKKHVLMPNKTKIYNFKKEHIESLPSSKRVFFAYTTSENLKLFEKTNDYINYEDLNFNGNINGNKEFHKLISNFNKIVQESQIKSLKKYYNSLLKEKIYQINNSKDDINYLLPIGKYQHSDYDIYYIESIINIPKELYLLYLFLRKEFKELSENEIKKILTLFDYIGEKEKTSINEEELEINERVLKLIK